MNEIHSNLIVKVAESTKKIFKGMLATEVEMASLQSTVPFDGQEVSALVVIGQKTKWVAHMHMAFDTAQKLASNFLGEDVSGKEHVIRDCVGEIANLVFGTAKSHLDQEDLSMSPPEIIHDSGHAIEFAKAGELCPILFDTVSGKVLVQICQVAQTGESWTVSPHSFQSEAA